MILFSIFVIFNIWLIIVYKRAAKIKHNNLIDYLNKIIHTVEIEKHSNIEYWFDTDSHQFLGQGATFEEIIDVVKSRFPDHIFLLKDQGGFCAKTNWQIVPFDELKTLDLATREGK